METFTDATARDIAAAIASWLRHQLDESGAERLVLGLSGGIDSATVCALCTQATTPDRVLGVIMPSHSSPLDAEHANLVASAFGIETATVDLTSVTEAFIDAMLNSSSSHATEHGTNRLEDMRRLAGANVRPRLRMTTLYYLANLRNGLVVGTGNKSESLVGYFTKYGDGGVDVLPIATLYKHEVRVLARVLGVPEPILAKAPSAGLWAGQTDEHELGMTYDQLDAALIALERGESNRSDSPNRERVRGMAQASEHKRQPIPTYRRADTNF